MGLGPRIVAHGHSRASFSRSARESPLPVRPTLSCLLSVLSESQRERERERERERGGRGERERERGERERKEFLKSGGFWDTGPGISPLKTDPAMLVAKTEPRGEVGGIGISEAILE